MTCELGPRLYERVRPLLENMKHNLTVTAVVDGTCPGAIWADDAERPRRVLLSTPEGHFLTGEQLDPEGAASLRELLNERIYPRGREQGWAYFCLHYPNRGWQESVHGVVGAKYPVWDYQQYFVLKDPECD